MSYSEVEVGADDEETLDKIIDSLTSIANPHDGHGTVDKQNSRISLKVGKLQENIIDNGSDMKKKNVVLILGAGRVCRPAVEFLASIGSNTSQQMPKSSVIVDFEEQNFVEVIVASLYLKDALEITEDIPNATPIQLNIADGEILRHHIKQSDVVISLLPASCHITVATACIEFKKHLVTASYVDESLSLLDKPAKSSGVTILGEMGLDPGIDHMMAMKMINQAHMKNGKIKSFTSYCGGLPSPAAANNPLAYKFSWNPAGAIRAGRNPATYRSHGETVQVDGDGLYDSASKIRIPDLPAFALECLPNRNSLLYGDLYGIQNEASTIFRGTLRYEGFSDIMGTLARIGFFSTEVNRTFKDAKRPTCKSFLLELLRLNLDDYEVASISEKVIAERIIELGHCKEKETASRTTKTILFLGFHEPTEIPASCQSAFDITCLCMEEKLAYSGNEEDMVLLHHEVEIEYPNAHPAESHRGTLLEFGRTVNGKSTTAMALTVGIPAAVGALLLLANKIQTSGVLRPILPEVYEPALDLLQTYGFRLLEKIEKL